MRFHVIGLPYVPMRREFSACAFTSRNLKFCRMMADLGHTVYSYGVDGGDASHCEHIPTVTHGERFRMFGDFDSSKVCYTATPFKWDAQQDYWRLFNHRAAEQVGRRLQKQDFVCVIGGGCCKPMIDLLKPHLDKFITVEHGIGYSGTFAPFRVFDSYAHMHRVYGAAGGDPDGKNFDAVIPCPYDDADFRFVVRPLDYYLFVGRMIDRKGVDIAVEATRRAGVKLVLCGQGARQEGDRIIADDGKVYQGSHLEYLGHISPPERSWLMGHARALLVPTKYLEPFGGVAVEAMHCGTPAITSDFGAFPETVKHGISGFRCRTLEQYVWAINHCESLSRDTISWIARQNYSLEKVGRMYQEYFDMLLTLWGEGFYASRERSQLDWLVKA